MLLPPKQNHVTPVLYGDLWPGSERCSRNGGKSAVPVTPSTKGMAEIERDFITNLGKTLIVKWLFNIKQ